MKATLLIHGFDKEKEDMLLDTLKSYDITPVMTNEDDLQQKVGYILGLDGYSKEYNNENYIGKEFILFQNFTRELLNDFLKDLASKNLNIPLKAALTETTKDWTLGYLIKHIEEEGKVVKDYMALGVLVKRAQENVDKFSNKEEIEFLIDKAKNLPKTEGEELTVEKIKDIKEKLAEVMKKNGV